MHRTVSEMNGSLTVSASEFVREGPCKASLSMSLCSSVRDDKAAFKCLVQPNGDGRLRFVGVAIAVCTAQRGRLVLSDVDTCKRERTSRILSSAEVAAMRCRTKVTNCQQ